MATGLPAVLLLMGISTECQAEVPVPTPVADVKKQAPIQPFLRLDMAGIDRGLACLQQCFDAAGQQEFEQLLDFQLHELADLAGIDRSQPVGIMLYAEDSLLPLPNPLVYLPLSNTESFLQTLNSCGLQVRHYIRSSSLYTVRPDAGITFYMLLQNDYAYLSLSLDVLSRVTDTNLKLGGRMLTEFDNGVVFSGQQIESLDRSFATPNEVVSGSRDSYDLSLTLDVRNVPHHLREMALKLVERSTGTALQQRDFEDGEKYKQRRASGEWKLRLVQRLAEETSQVVLGYQLKPDGQSTIELTIRAEPGSRFARELTALRGRTSQFIIPENRDVVLTVSCATTLRTREAQAIWNVPVTSLAEGLGAQDSVGLNLDEYGRAARSWMPARFPRQGVMVPVGNLDLLIQGQLTPRGKIEFDGGISLRRSDAIAGEIRLVRAADDIAPLSRKRREMIVAAVLLDTLSSNLGAAASWRRNEADWGPHFDSSRSTLWFSTDVVSSRRIAEFESSPVKTVQSQETRATERVPIWIELKACPWFLSLMTPDERAPDTTGICVSLIREAFSEPGSDLVEIQAGPVSNGFRVRAELSFGFTHLLGRLLANAIDRRQAL